MIRVFIADSCPLFRLGVRTVLEETGRMAVTGEAPDGHTVLEVIERQAPDVLIVESNLPFPASPGVSFVTSGLEVLSRVRRRAPAVACILLSAYEDEEELFQALKAGAAAYCPRDILPALLVEAVERVAAGEYLIDGGVLARPAIVARVLGTLRTPASTDEREQPALPLSDRELAILQHIAYGQSNREIARTLHLSAQTVKNHVASIMRKLAVNDRTQAVVYAVRRGWISI